MTAYAFYHLTTAPLEKALPRLLEKVLEAGLRVVVVTDSVERARELDRALWTYTPLSFLPHGCAAEEAPKYPSSVHPIWITTGAERPNDAQVLVFTDGATEAISGQDATGYQRCLYVFDGNDPEGLEGARELWKSHRNAQAPLTYWRQSASGGWEKV